MDTFTSRTVNDIKVFLEQTETGWTLSSRFFFCHSGELSNTVAWMVWGEVGIFDFKELSTLVRTARRLARRKGSTTPGEFRAAVSAALLLRKKTVKAR